jgi:hypothetical protein
MNEIINLSINLSHFLMKIWYEKSSNVGYTTFLDRKINKGNQNVISHFPQLQ